MNFGGVILCGGQSLRMGKAKALLPVGDELMLARVARLLGEIVHPLVVVAARDQELPDLADDIIIARDSRPGRGPLQGLRDGLFALPQDVGAAYVTGCDVPLLKPAFVQQVINQLGDADVAVPMDGEFTHPLAAVYRTSVIPQIDELLATDQLKVGTLIECCLTNEVAVEQLRAVDPNLESLINCNRPDDYVRALRKLGFPAPDGFA